MRSDAAIVSAIGFSHRTSSAVRDGQVDDALVMLGRDDDGAEVGPRLGERARARRCSSAPARRRARRGRTPAPAGSTSTSAAISIVPSATFVFRNSRAPALAEDADADMDDALHASLQHGRGAARTTARCDDLRVPRARVAASAPDPSPPECAAAGSRSAQPTRDQAEIELVAEGRRPRAPARRGRVSILPQLPVDPFLRLLLGAAAAARCGPGSPRPMTPSASAARVRIRQRRGPLARQAAGGRRTRRRGTRR